MEKQRILRVRATVGQDGRIAVTVPALPAGAAVELLLLLPETAGAPFYPSRIAAQRSMQTAADVELFLEAERVAWEH